ncbi:Pho86p Ecym_5226 [Eremothecium cymbalariae DBVPG|uniref:Inorganic phosphate transporter PHO86 n=1 Tax=Eremothecium cymbalariae (strain CBS 270.75 / DBVPG 7215 / KCTC 17166 / NRRL Y-17582) TaxID=931890 RepID=I6ND52_ERECY|nr:hypothetical protein Ecym_5226 [Eremothecium cymbalariae DBVPG\
MPFPQLDPNLTKPIDRDAPPTIYGSVLKPELATAALNLPIDFLKQKESLANQYLAAQKLTLGSILFAVVVYMCSSCTLPRERTGSVVEYVYLFAGINRKEMVTALIVSAISASLLLTSLAKLTNAVFKAKSKVILDSHGISVFNVDLTKLGAGDPSVTKDKNLENTHIVVYRETPIALVTVQENKSLSTKDALVVSISSMGSRLVYLKSGILEDLIDWALVRTKKIQHQSDKYKKGTSMKLIIEVYSFDTHMKETLKKKGFSVIESYKLPESRILGGLFSIKRELWGIQFHFESKKEK